MRIDSYGQFVAQVVQPMGLYEVLVKVPSTCGGFNGTSSDPAIVAVTATAECPADLNSDGIVNGADLGVVLGTWGPCR